MNAKETLPVLAKLAPVLAVAGPPVLIGAAIGVVLLWLLSGDKNPKNETAALPAPPDVQQPSPIESATQLPPNSTVQPKTASRRITRDDLATALEYGARRIPRGEAVKALQSLGYGKTSAYNALSPNARFSALMEQTADGLIEWKG